MENHEDNLEASQAIVGFLFTVFNVFILPLLMFWTLRLIVESYVRTVYALEVAPNMWTGYFRNEGDIQKHWLAAILIACVYRLGTKFTLLGQKWFSKTNYKIYWPCLICYILVYLARIMESHNEFTYEKNKFTLDLSGHLLILTFVLICTFCPIEKPFIFLWKYIKTLI